MEMQLYPPGNPPFVDSESCDDSRPGVGSSARVYSLLAEGGT